jgi:hypothetical protein
LPKRIGEDHSDFLDVIGGKKRKQLKKFISRGSIVRKRGKNGKISIAIPRIDTPRIVFGDNDEGVGRGPGKPGDVVGRDPQPGKGKGKGNASNDPGEGITINVDLEEVLNEMEKEWKLPTLKPKPNQVLQEERIKYNDIALVGPESLRHNRRTFQQALKRSCAMGNRELIYRPGFVDPTPAVSIIRSDKRYRQYKVVQEPSSNAAIFFARDWSGSMDETKCEIVSDMAWWMEQFISRRYKRTERVYVGHDTIAEECSQKKFYNYRYGGGTNCSSAFRFISQQFENRFPPNNWNIYILYFTDGDNWSDDNEKLIGCLKNDFGPEVVNMVGVTQILSWRYANSVKARIDEELESKGLKSSVVRTTFIGNEQKDGNYGGGTLTEDDRNEQIMRAIGDLFGADRSMEKVA